METAPIGTFDVRRGDAFALNILSEEDGDGATVDLDAYGPTWTSQIRVTPNARESIPFEVDATNIDGHLGEDEPQLVLALSPETTRRLTADTYVFDVQVSGGPAGTQTLYEGTLRVAADVTR